MNRAAGVALAAVAALFAVLGYLYLTVDQAPIRRGPIPLPSSISQQLATANPTP